MKSEIVLQEKWLNETHHSKKLSFSTVAKVSGCTLMTLESTKGGIENTALSMYI